MVHWSFNKVEILCFLHCNNRCCMASGVWYREHRPSGCLTINENSYSIARIYAMFAAWLV